MPKKKIKDGKPQVHKELKGFEIKINEFGQIVSNMDAVQMNEFLNKHVEDKKLRDITEEAELLEELEEEEDIEDVDLPDLEKIEQALEKDEEDKTEDGE